SMKLQAKQYDGRKVRRVYDAAKTPLQRLLLSQVLPAPKVHELQREVQVLDPLRLFHHLQDLQLALLGSTTSVSPDSEGTSTIAVLPFCVEQCIAGPCTAGSLAVEEVIHTAVPDPGQLEHEGDGNASSACTSACFSSVAPSQQTMEEGPF